MVQFGIQYVFNKKQTARAMTALNYIFLEFDLQSRQKYINLSQFVWRTSLFLTLVTFTMGNSIVPSRQW